MGADWLEEGMQENDWVGVMMLALSVTAWETESDVKNRPMSDYRSSLLHLHMSCIHIIS